MPVNGSDQETIQISDRGLAYGDGVFETIRIENKQLLLADAHLRRMELGAQTLKIPFDRATLQAEIDKLAADFPGRGVLKIMLTRGSGGRGYRPPDTCEPQRILTLHPIPEYVDEEKGIDVFVCTHRLSFQPALAGLKHLNRLEQVLASLEWPADSFSEGLMLDQEDNIIEGTRSNLFWVEDAQLMTPALDRCGVSGVMRDYLLDLLPSANVVNESPLQRLASAQEVFVCNSVFGIWPVNTIKSTESVITFPGPVEKRTVTTRAQELFNQLLKDCEH